MISKLFFLSLFQSRCISQNMLVLVSEFFFSKKYDVKLQRRFDPDFFPLSIFLSVG